MQEPFEEAHDDGLNFAVYIGLLTLTALTVGAAQLPGGRILAVSTALIVASAKAGLIVFYYMNLRRERALMWSAVVISGLAVAALLIGIIPDLTFFPK